MTVDEKIFKVLDDFDLDFNLGNVVMACLKSHYQDNPIDTLERCKILLGKRIEILKQQLEQSTYVKRSEQ